MHSTILRQHMWEWQSVCRATGSTSAESFHWPCTSGDSHLGGLPPSTFCWTHSSCHWHQLPLSPQPQHQAGTGICNPTMAVDNLFAASKEAMEIFALLGWHQDQVKASRVTLQKDQAVNKTDFLLELMGGDREMGNQLETACNSGASLTALSWWLNHQNMPAWVLGCSLNPVQQEATGSCKHLQWVWQALWCCACNVLQEGWPCFLEAWGSRTGVNCALPLSLQMKPCWQQTKNCLQSQNNFFCRSNYGSPL